MTRRDGLPRLGVDMTAGVPICGVTGINGAGKTLVAVQAAIVQMSQGREVYSTVQIRSPWGDSKPILSLRQLLTLRNVTILLDDVAVIFSSRSSQSLPNEIVVLLQVLRHRECTIIWTAPAWMRCDNLLRDVTQGLVNVVPLRLPAVFRNGAADPWPRPGLVMAALLDTSQGKTDETPTSVMRRKVFRPTRFNSWGAYDTKADTPMLGMHLAGGKCVDCGGSMETPKHNKARHEHLGLPWYGDDVRVPSNLLAAASEL